MLEKMLRIGLFLAVVLLMLQSSCWASEDIQDDEESEVTSSSHEVVDSFPSRITSNTAHQYPWRVWNFPYYQARTPQIPFAGSGGGSPPMADPRFVTNRCNTRQPYPTTTTTPCWATTVTFTMATFTTTTTVTTTVYPPTTTPYTPTTDTTTTAYWTTTPFSTNPPTSSTDSSTSTTDTTTYSPTTSAATG